MNNFIHEQDYMHDNRQRHLRELLAVFTEIARSHPALDPRGIGFLNEDEQQEHIDKLNPYVRFELEQHPDLHDLPLSIRGTGMLIVSDFDGNILGFETVKDNDIITGKLTDACIIPTPTIDCIIDSDDDSIPVADQVLSPVIILNDGVFKTNHDGNGVFETEHDLSNFQIGLPLAHYLKIDIANTTI